ncbi:UDP-2,3-diacylglucosamine hydrolase [Novimethylophilus kurashikiensis]|uniref:UDP-2,3-diacylglucosamine hydrolase n=1 Tax=Novimethylophilus kurashikiensis TaxID=1825523 RepID=A0A2R5FBX6_9PROT|nr:UDP-2,3-diacylglucosamine diphosphatase [Novimethylophilus kurashikiensis]GBG14201.1 UDP-2,3-diacylglucosamine hydrolase [Novimethylophilus kurashikiensis]
MILFISDLHLCQERPRTTQLFLDFLSREASQAAALYILGDLFEYWAGDDDVESTYIQSVLGAMRRLSDSGTKVYVMRGNRDVLLGAGFEQASGAELLPDPVMIDLYGRSALLTHGDALCTDDVEYQQFRQMVRDSKWQQDFLSLPLAQRKSQIQALRSRSEEAKSYKAEAIMDVNQDAVAECLRTHGYPPLLIHGHTHRPARHSLEIDGKHCERIVLSDWGDTGSYLLCTKQGCEVVNL